MIESRVNPNIFSLFCAQIARVALEVSGYSSTFRLTSPVVSAIGVARGCIGCTCTPRAKKIGGGANLQKKVVSAPQAKSAPPRRSKSPLFEDIEEIWAVGEVIQAVLACVLRTTTKKVVSFFGEDKILAMPMVSALTRSLMSLHMQSKMIAASECSPTDGAVERSVSSMLAIVTRQLVGARELPTTSGPVAAVRFLSRVCSHVSLEVRTLGVRLAAAGA